MSFKLTHPLPKQCLVAVSGGLDSVAALHWLSRKEERVQGIVHFNHNTGKFADMSQRKVEGIASTMGLPLYKSRIDQEKRCGASTEEWWREQRYNWFLRVSERYGDLPVVVAHNMDDCLEEMIMCSMVRGYQGTIPYAMGPSFRPFRMWKREDIHEYAVRHKITWAEDPSNLYTHRYKRAYIRHKIVPLAKELNPGIYNIVARVIREQDRRGLQTRSSIG